MKNSTANNSSKTAQKTSAKIVNVNIDSVTKRLSNIIGTNQKTKDSIYIYPENFTAIDISSKKGKSFRVKMRNNFEKIVNAFTSLQMQLKVKSITAIEFANSTKELKNLFVDFYKENYRINDYSFASVSQSNNEDKKTEILNFLSFCKDISATKKITPKTANKSAKKAIVKDSNIAITNDSVKE